MKYEFFLEEFKRLKNIVKEAKNLKQFRKYFEYQPIDCRESETEIGLIFYNNNKFHFVRYYKSQKYIKQPYSYDINILRDCKADVIYKLNISYRLKKAIELELQERLEKYYE